MRRKLVRRVITVIVVVSAASALANQSPVRVHGPQRGTTGSHRQSISIAHEAARILGTDSAVAGEYVLLSDDNPFGVSGDRVPVWVFSTSLSIHDGDVLRTVRGTLAMLESGHPIAFFTDPRYEWVRPMADGPDSEDHARSADWWKVTAAESYTLRLSVADVLQKVWRQCGVAATEAGQIVIRPRRVNTPFPGRLVGEQVVPLYPEGEMWIIEVLGTRFPDSDDRYWSRALMLIDDKTGDLIKTIYLP